MLATPKAGAAINDKSDGALLPSPKFLLMDVASAMGASVCVSPIIASIDQAIISNAAGSHTLVGSLKDSFTQLLTRPHQFLTKPAFLLVWGVYSGTYIMANFVTSTCDHYQATSQTRNYSKFFLVSGTNISLNVAKDRIFTRMFGTGPPKPLPMPSLGIFALRDSMTVFASFNLSPMVAEKLTNDGYMSKGKATTAAQLVCPIAMQWLSAPLHLLGLDLYNNPGAQTSERTAAIKKNYFQTALARSARIGPAFGVGQLLNMPLREKLHSFVK